jgi:hypothetical protein
VDGKMLHESLLDVNVATELERGMLGIAVSEGKPEKTAKHNFVYHTVAQSMDVEDAVERGPTRQSSI